MGKIYDEWTDKTSCNIEFSRWTATIDPSNYQITIKGNLGSSWSDGGYKFDNGWINKFNPKKIFTEGEMLKYEISIPYSKWRKHKILLVNKGTGSTLTKIDLKVINRARKHHQACLKGGPSWLY